MSTPRTTDVPACDSLVSGSPLGELGARPFDLRALIDHDHRAPGVPMAVADYRVGASPTSWRWTADDGGTWVCGMGVVVEAHGRGRGEHGAWYGYPDWTIRERDGGRIGPYTTDAAAIGAFTTAAVRHLATAAASPRVCRWCAGAFVRREGEAVADYAARRYCSKRCVAGAAAGARQGYSTRREADWYAARALDGKDVRQAARVRRQRAGAGRRGTP